MTTHAPLRCFRATWLLALVAAAVLYAVAAPAADDPVESPLMTQAEWVQRTARSERADMDRQALESIRASLSANQVLHAQLRVSNILGGRATNAGEKEFGGLLDTLWFFPSTSSVVDGVVARARSENWSLLVPESHADLVLARKRAGGGDRAPIRFEFLVPYERRDAFRGFMEVFAREGTSSVVSEVGQRAGRSPLDLLGSLARGKQALTPSVSIALDMSGELDRRLLVEKRKARGLIAMSTYAIAMQYEKLSWFGQPQGTGVRGFTWRWARSSAAGALRARYGAPNNAAIGETTQIAAVTILAEISAQDELRGALTHLGQAGAGSNFGLVLRSSTSDSKRDLFAVGEDEMGVRAVLPGGDVIPLGGANAATLGRLAAWAALERQLSRQSVEARVRELRRDR